MKPNPLPGAIALLLTSSLVTPGLALTMNKQVRFDRYDPVDRVNRFNRSTPLDACQIELERTLNERIDISSTSVETIPVSDSIDRLQGQAELYGRPFGFDCEVNLRTGQVLGLDYDRRAFAIAESRSDQFRERPLSFYDESSTGFGGGLQTGDDPAVISEPRGGGAFTSSGRQSTDRVLNACRGALEGEINRAIAIDLGTLEETPVAGRELRLRGEGRYDTERGLRYIQFNCVYDPQFGEVQRVDFRSLDGEPTGRSPGVG